MLPNYKPKEDAKQHIKDFAKSLSKGDYVTPKQIAKLTSEDPGSATWLLVVLTLRDAVMGLREDLQLKTEKGGLRVLLDKEAGSYNSEQIFRHVKGIRKQTRLMMNRIDTSKLNADELRQLDQQRYVANCLTLGMTDSIRHAKRQTKSES